MRRLAGAARRLAHAAADAAGGFLRGFLGLGLASPGTGPGCRADGPATAASARADLVRRAERRPTCC